MSTKGVVITVVFRKTGTEPRRWNEHIERLPLADVAPDGVKEHQKPVRVESLGGTISLNGLPFIMSHAGLNCTRAERIVQQRGNQYFPSVRWIFEEGKRYELGYHALLEFCKVTYFTFVRIYYNTAEIPDGIVCYGVYVRTERGKSTHKVTMENGVLRYIVN